MRRAGFWIGAAVLGVVLYWLLQPEGAPRGGGHAEGDEPSGCSAPVTAGDAGAPDASVRVARHDAGVVVDAPDAGRVQAGAIVGEVRLGGTPPPAEVANRDADPYCKSMTEADIPSVLVRDGRLENVVVRIADSMSRPARGNVTVDQRGCEYRPRVLGIVAGQGLVVRNGDQTLHNVHTYPPEGERAFNRAQVPGGPDIRVTYTTHGAIVGIRCDVHPWMAAWVSVTNHPWFDVTNEDGVFEISDVPAGTYEVEAWHERFGSKRARATVAPDGAAEIRFEYDGTEIR